jgi:hypothetical protein
MLHIVANSPVFVVYTENNERVYKSLLPVYFPPVNVNVNKALPTQLSPSSRSVNIPGSSEPSELPRRTLFSTVGDAIRGVKFGKWPATNAKRPPGSQERFALESFERHARGCSKCIHIEKVYFEKGHLCSAGYEAAQSVLEYLYMDADRSVYSTNAEGGPKSRVEIPPEYPLSWNLLMMVERSFRDEDQSRPFVSPNQPWQGLAEQQPSEADIPPGVTIYNAEVTIPREPEKAIAYVYLWSAGSVSWEPFRSHATLIHIYPGTLRFYANGYSGEIQAPHLSLKLNQNVQIQRYGSLEVTIANARIYTQIGLDPSTSLMLKSRSPTENQMLLTRLLHAVENDPTPTVADSNLQFGTEERELDNTNSSPAPTEDPTHIRRTSPFAPDEVGDTKDLRSRISALKSASTSLHSPTPESPNRTNPQTPTLLGRKILQRLNTLAQPNAGLHRQQLADTLDVDVQEVSRSAEHLKALGLAHTVFGSSETWVATNKSDQSPTLARKLSFGQYRDTEQKEVEEWSASEQELSPELGPSIDADMLSSGIEDMDITGQSVRSSQHQQSPQQSTTSKTESKDVDSLISGFKE